MLQIVAFLAIAQGPLGPIDFAKRELTREAGAKADNVEVSIRKGGPKESFRIEGDGKKVRIVGSDAVGAMYGAYEFAERLHQKGDPAWKTHFADSPYLPERGLNLFLTLPWDYKKNDTDYAVSALTDPSRYWFANDDYWTTLLDLMAKSRLNWLDIHGMWDISVTNAPNLYAYFVTSPSFPLVGVPSEVKTKDLGQLNHVISMAHARGIRVSLMAYEANLKIPQNPNPPYKATEQNIYKYTREVVNEMIRNAPGLDAIGFRIGESGHGEDFFTCYQEAVKDSGRDIPLITRSWITRKQKVLPLARASKDFSVKIKYNGEHWAAPYPIMGGRMANWGSYSFEDYFSDSGPGGKKMWPGWPTSDGSHWPNEPYKVIWQVRANGTHRIFPFYNPNWVRRSITAMKMGTATGYTVEGEDAYYPKSPDYYLADLKNKYCDWIHQRDEMYWLTWGRLGYDPKTPDETFDARAEELLGEGSKRLVDEWKDASILIPWSTLSYSLGPDHRDYAPELEYGGDFDAFLQGAGFDTFSFAPVTEQVANGETEGADGRLKFGDPPVQISQAFGAIRRPPFVPNGGRGKEIRIAVQMMRNRFEYLRDRSEFSYVALRGMLFSPHIGPEWYAERPRYDLSMMASEPFYRPFTEKLRMHTNDFTWKSQLALFEQVWKGQLANIGPESRKFEGRGDHRLFDRVAPELTWSPQGRSIVCRVTAQHIQRAWLLEKPLPSSTMFHRSAMVATKDGFEAKFQRRPWGHAIAAEIEVEGQRYRVPYVKETTPYLVIPAQPKPTPQIYSAEEAMTYLDPKIITPQKYGAMLIGTRADFFFHRYSRSTMRKLLEPVSKGLPLIILQEDFTKDRLDFLPVPPQIEGVNLNHFDGSGQFGMPVVDAPGLMWQRFLPTRGWELFGNNGLARYPYGKGAIWVCSARLMQNMTVPSAAQAFVKLLSIGGTQKPTVVIDAGSERPGTSCHEDLMNSHGIPFVTLGEAIATEQGMNSFTPIPGPTFGDDVLEGRGPSIAQSFVRNQVIALSKRPTPPSLDAFEQVRVTRRKELMRSLGLDPMPAKTSLNVKIKGVLQRDGYKIEKFAFESRPKFYVTGHIYVPDGVHDRLPVIMNVNGHWNHKKDEFAIQLRAAFQARQGYLAVAIDSPGYSFEGNSLIERRAEGAHQDAELVQGGTNTTGYYVWDAIRALDYVATRPDADMDRVGITGASGGGLATLYTFAADDRYKAAVPVVYMASMELAPDNGCLCNHVPATCQIGDRSDVMAIAAPKPVFLIGAQLDGEFPPDATRLTHKKMQDTWKLFGKQNDVYVTIFGGGHDYNQQMREASIGFFNRYLKGQGDGSPVPQPALVPINPEDRSLLALDPPPTDERTMRDLSLEYLADALQVVSVDDVIAVNGGRPTAGELNYKELSGGPRRAVTFEAEPGLVTPGILHMPQGAVKGVRICMNDSGKASPEQFAGTDGFAVLNIDGLGTGELADLDLRYPLYAGRAVAFTAGWQFVRAAEAMRRYSTHIEIVGDGQLSSLAAMYAGLFDTHFDHVTGLNGLRTWADIFAPAANPMAIQPRAHLCGSLESLKKMVKNATWK